MQQSNNKIHHHQLILSSVNSGNNNSQTIQQQNLILSQYTDTATFNNYNPYNNHTNLCQSIINNPVEKFNASQAKCNDDHQHQNHVKHIIFKLLGSTIGVDSIIKRHRKSFRRKGTA